MTSYRNSTHRPDDPHAEADRARCESETYTDVVFGILFIIAIAAFITWYWLTQQPHPVAPMMPEWK